MKPRPKRGAVCRCGRAWLGAPSRSRKLKPLIASTGIPVITDSLAFVAATWLFLAIPGAGNLAILSSAAQGRAVPT